MSQPQPEDVLGLEQIQKTRRVRIAKLDENRLFHPVTGVSYVLKNHPRVSKKLRHHDRRLTQSKADREFENLGSVLDFYHLWCHGLFPKAQFGDCIAMVRQLGAKLARTRLWRRHLVDYELNKAKVAAGLMDELEVLLIAPTQPGHDGSQAPEPEEGVEMEVETTEDAPEAAEEDYVAPDDFAFMELALFVGEEGHDEPETRETRVETATRRETETRRQTETRVEPPREEEVPPEMEDAGHREEDEEIPLDIEQMAFEQENEARNKGGAPGSPDPFSDDDAELLASISQR